MARDGSGNYNLPAGQPVVTATVISSTVFNTFASDVAAALTQSLSKDGQTTPTANLPMGGFKHTGVLDGNARNNYASIGQMQDSTYMAVGGVAGTNTITGSLAPAITSYVSGMLITMIPAVTNTGAVTIALNGLAAKAIVKSSATALTGSELLAGASAYLVYNGTAFVLLNPISAWTIPAPVAGNALTITGLSGSQVNGALALYLIAPTIPKLSLRDSANGFDWSMYLSGGGVGALTFRYEQSSLDILSMTRNGNVAIASPSSGSTLTLTGTTDILKLIGTGSAPYLSWFKSDGTTRIGYVQMQSGTSAYLVVEENIPMDFRTNNTVRQVISAAGNISWNAPASGTHTINLLTGANLKLATGAASSGSGLEFAQSGQTSAFIYNPASSNTLSLYTNGADRIQVVGASGTHGAKVADSAASTWNIGFLETPPNTQNTNYTLVLSDAGKMIYHSDGSGYTWTIPSNASVAYPVGTVLTFMNDASGAVNITIAITTDTLAFTPGGTTGSRTLAQYGRAVALKVAATRWIIGGTGLT